MRVFTVYVIFIENQNERSYIRGQFWMGNNFGVGCYLRGFATFGTLQHTEKTQMFLINHSVGVVSHKIRGITQTTNIVIDNTLTNKDGFWASARAAPLIRGNKQYYM